MKERVDHLEGKIEMILQAVNKDSVAISTNTAEQ